MIGHHETAVWRKSSRSGNSGGQCVELRSGLTAVRDSKNLDGPVLEIGPEGLAAFLAAAKADRF
ncbi:hypothetical protein GCM10022243_39900 [Saccharothrix violaceirubra]|uniref:DUF397 domain-containing protein n=1 Tax=Saccharothrix violaceirubra TaxID=413306 RepID=A0A7W7T8E9_9PSEU|nr:DUF397 domain-containing protein [Saccharothrix violaceirubra]MBB4968246.1 hypothetical protein [Saccharothrix violaceirubra]